MRTNIRETYSQGYAAESMTVKTNRPVVQRDGLNASPELPEDMFEPPEGNLQWFVADTDFVMGVRRPEIDGATKPVGGGEGTISIPELLFCVG